MTSATFAALGGLGLFFYGLRKLLRSFESFASSRVRPTLHRAFSGPLTSWLCGAFLTLVSQSGNLSVIALMGLTEMGFIGVRSAYFAMLGSSAGTTAWLWYILSGLHLGPVILALGAFGLILARTEYWEELMSAILAIGMTFLGVEFLFSGASVLFADILREKVELSGGAISLSEQLTFVALGIVLGLILQSASAPLVLLFSLVPEAELTLSTGTALYLGANLGLTVTTLILSSRTREVTKRLAWAHFLTKGVGVVGAIFLFPTFLALVERVSSVFTPNPNLTTQLVVAQLMFSLINSLIFGALADPVMRILAHWFPEKEIHGLGLARRVRRMLYQDPDLASKELDRQLRQLELEVKANYDQVMYRLTTTDVKDSYRERALRERNFRSLKFTIHDLLFSVDRHRDGQHAEGAVILSLLEYYGALSRTLFHLEDHYEKGLSKKFLLPTELQAGVAQFKVLLDELWRDTLLHHPPEDEVTDIDSVASLEEIVLQLNKRLGAEYQGYSTWLMETAGYLRLISSDLGQLVQRRSQLRSLAEG